MKRFIKSILLFIFVGIGLSLFSQNSSSLLWEVNGNGLEKSSYIFGTIHILPKKQFQKFKIADSKLKKSDILVLELLLDVPIGTKLKWAQLMILPDNKTVEDYMESAQTSHFRNLMIDSIGWSESKYNRYIKMKPFAIYSVVLSESMGKITGYETHFEKIAKRKNIESVGLETFEFQLGLFDAIPVSDQMDMLFGDDFTLDFDPLLKYYFDQNIDSIYSFSAEAPDISIIKDKVLDERNENWVKQFEKLSEKNSLFIAVGAGHLGGPKGVIALLREKGYTLKPIKLED